jgi:hypothetical protein
MKSFLKKLFTDSAILSIRYFLIQEIDYINQEIIKKPYDAEELIKKRDEYNHALFGA